MLNILSLCDGISVGLKAFEENGLVHNKDFKYFAVEINKNSRKVSDHNFKNIKRPAHDIARLGTIEILETLPPFDWCIFGFSCKKLSSQSMVRDLKGDSQFTFEQCMRILSLVKFRNPSVKFMIENVASMPGTVKDRLSKMINANVYRIDSKNFSAQGRNRFYWANFEIKKELPTCETLANDLMDSGTHKAWSKSTRYFEIVDKKEVRLVHKKRGCISRIEERLRKDGKANTLVTGRGCCGQSTKNSVIESDGSERVLSVKECARLQTLDDFDFSCVSDTIAYRCIGDSWNLKTVSWIIKNGLTDNEK